MITCLLAYPSGVLGIPVHLPNGLGASGSGSVSSLSRAAARYAHAQVASRPSVTDGRVGVMWDSFRGVLGDDERVSDMGDYARLYDHSSHQHAQHSHNHVSPDISSGKFTAVHDAISGSEHQCTQCFDFLLRNGAPTGTRDAQGRLPIHAAAQQSSGMPFLTRLLESPGQSQDRDRVRQSDMEGWTVNSKMEGGLRPLHLAARRNDKKMVEFLLSRGANVLAETDQGELPSDLAADPRLIAYLVRRENAVRSVGDEVQGEGDVELTQWINNE